MTERNGVRVFTLAVAALAVLAAGCVGDNALSVHRDGSPVPVVVAQIPAQSRIHHGAPVTTRLKTGGSPGLLDTEDPEIPAPGGSLLWQSHRRVPVLVCGRSRWHPVVPCHKKATLVRLAPKTSPPA